MEDEQKNKFHCVMTGEDILISRPREISAKSLCDLDIPKGKILHAESFRSSHSDLLNISVELLFYIFSFFDIKTIGKTLFVNKLFCEISIQFHQRKWNDFHIAGNCHRDMS
jgi:hypothetical protein